LRQQSIKAAEVVRLAVEELPELRFDRFNAAETLDWNLETYLSDDRVARTMLPNVWAAWDQVSREVLYMELVAQVTDFRNHGHAEASPTFLSEPSRNVPGVTWLRQIEDNRMTISTKEELVPASPRVQRRLSLQLSMARS
jgi:hypothetical protein